MNSITEANLRAALELAGAGLPVFPAIVTWNQSTRKHDKRPAIARWQTLASDDEETIQNWWTAFPTALVGLELGRADLVAVDLDRHPDQPDGVQAFRALSAGRPLPKGPVVRTASNGLHLIFRNNGEMTNARGGLPPGIDIRAKGGWIVAPGSTCPTGAWRAVPGRPSLPRSTAIPAVPQWLIAIIRAPVVKPEPMRGAANAYSSFLSSSGIWWLRGLTNTVASAPVGTRNKALFWGACRAGEHIRKGQGSVSEATAALLEAATACGLVHDDGQAAVLATIKSGLNR